MRVDSRMFPPPLNANEAVAIETPGLATAAIVTSLIHPSSSPVAVAGVIALALLAGMATSLLIGFITGCIVAFLGVHPILVTLGTMTAVKGISVYVTNGGVVGGFPAAILWMGNGTLLGVPVSMILFIFCAVVVALIMTHTPFGVAVRMIGSNEKATRYSGVATNWMLVGVYVLSSLLCWVASIIMMARFNSARAGYAESYLLITILAAVLGGVDPNGGFGRVLGLFLSLILLQEISTGFNLLGFSPHLTEAIWGGHHALRHLYRPCARPMELAAVEKQNSPIKGATANAPPSVSFGRQTFERRRARIVVLLV